MNNDMDKRKSAIWDEIIKEAQERTRPVQDGEMTVKMFAEQSGLGYRWASCTLEKLVAEGKLTRRWAIIDAHRTAIYSPIQIEEG